MQNEESIPQETGGHLFTRNFILVFFGFFTIIAANHALIPTLPIYLTQLGSKEREVGILVGIAALAALLARFFVGGLLTKYSEKKVMITGAVIFALTFPAAIALSHFWPLLFVRVGQGVGLACFHTAALAYVVKAVPPDRMAQGIAYFMLAPNFAMAVVAPSGVFLVNHYGYVVFFLSCTGLCVCSLWLSWNVNEPSISVTPEKSISARSPFLPEWKIVVPAVTNFMQMFVFGGLTAFLPLYALERGIANPGHFFTANAVVMIAGRALGGRILDTYNKEKMILVFIFISLISLVILSFTKSLPLLVFVGLLWGTGAAFFTPACMSYAFEFAGTSSGAAVGTYQAFMDLGMALGPVVMGMILPRTGYPVMWISLAFVCLVSLAYFQIYVRKKGKKKLE